PPAYSTPKPAPRTDQEVKRVSSAAKIAYMPTPMTPTTSSAANTSGTLKLEGAISITLPMPLLPAMISAMTVPTNDSVIAILSEAKKYGSERGMPIFTIMSRRVAPRTRRTSSSSGSMVAKPVATLTTTGKNESRNAVMIAGIVPTPNQMTSTGTNAAFGTLLKAISSGYSE